MKLSKYIIMFSSILLLTGCNFGESTEEKLSNILTEIYDLEADYRDVQKELAETETKEQANFQQMMELTKDQKEELTSMVEDTATLLDARLALVEKEAASLNATSDGISKLTTLISETKEASDKESLKQMETTLKERIAAYEELTYNYNELATKQQDLYNMLVDDSADVTSIQEQVQVVNKHNELVKESVQKFNEATKRVNEVKDDVLTSLQKDEK
ncbi:Putative cell-wall binding lipoprotein [Psychrobacillus sp. OK028]|uniref:YkyA family protein n=1 Tax=Psychrobacillus sp. OK028 TaxID=1884359 RepID=UPI00087E28F9|nr:YkyA family protein [Psychrobacillus sp. OK028]SDM49348.1 Putative cell-wall binding lipoprotein [Psychrobacillus sp. OK028]